MLNMSPLLARNIRPMAAGLCLLAFTEISLVHAEKPLPSLEVLGQAINPNG